MSQIFHILRKDVRHLWIEIVVSLVVLAAYVWKTIHGWSTPEELPGLLDVLWGVVTPLVPISWCLLVIRAVHDESLVGDRQFWVTRPYEWTRLLAAKALFAATFINVPSFIANMVFLHKAGFPSLHYLPGLLLMQVLLAAFLILPATIAAVVTSTIVQVLLSVVGVLLYLIASGSLGSVIPNSGIGRGDEVIAICGLAIFLAVGVSVLLVQYARRLAWRSRLLIFAGAALMLVVVAGTPYGTVIAHAYPVAASAEPPMVEFQLLPPLPPSPRNRVPFGDPRHVELLFPVQAAGVSPDGAVIEAGSLTTIQAPDGRRWTSNWIGSGEAFWPGQAQTALRLSVDKSFFQSEKSVPVSVHVSFALTSYRETHARQVVSQAGTFPVAGVGSCWLESEQQWDGNLVRCRAPLVPPGFMARMEPSASTCPLLPAGAAPPDMGTRYAWGGAPPSGPAEFGINPIADVTFWFQRWSDNSENTKLLPPGVCPGTPFTVSTPEEGKSVRVEAELEGVHLSDYALPTQQGGVGGMSFSIGAIHH